MIKICPICGRGERREANYCSNCGAQLAGNRTTRISEIWPSLRSDVVKKTPRKKSDALHIDKVYKKPPKL